MKRFLKTLTVLATVASGAVLFQHAAKVQPASAQGIPFVCSTSYSGLLTTYAQLPNGTYKPIIRWVSNHFSGSGYTPAQRCQTVSQRFTRLSAQGRLQVLNTGWLNNAPVVCAGYNCTNDNLLFTLRRDQSPSRVLSELLSNQAGASTVSYQTGLNESEEDRMTVDFQSYLDSLPTETLSDSSSTPQNTAPAAPQTSPRQPVVPAPSSGSSDW